MGLFNRTKLESGKSITPVWFMRQAGRYHAHYQNLKKNHTFMELCKNPNLACEVTMGPIDEFNFDAAILFSDLLFPLEHLNLGLSYDSGKPEILYLLKDRNNLKRLKTIDSSENFYNFQKEALKLLKQRLPQDKSLIGFIGSPFTLYTYAMEGSHAGNLIDTKKGLYDGTFDTFAEYLIPCLIDEAIIQIDGGADTISIFDTSVGELCFKDFTKFVLPKIKNLTKEIKAYNNDIKIIYYSKFTHLHYLEAIEDKNIDVLGVDWRNSITKVLDILGKNYYIQGNIDPSWLHLDWNHLKANLSDYKNELFDSGADLNKYIFGLGHGVIIQTPEINVKNTVDFIHSNFHY